LENRHPTEPISSFALRATDVMEELEVIAEQLRTKGAITKQDLETLIRQRHQKSSRP
jgi:hypothetical protein